MPSRTPEEIISLVTEHEDATLLRRERMDEDYSMWQLNELPENKSIRPEDPGIGAGYRHYTSNEPRTFAAKVVAIAASAKVIPRVKATTSLQTQYKRGIQNDKERFIIGALVAADERLANMLQPNLQDQLSWYAPMRGWLSIRALLRKRPDGSTFVDIQPLDPRNTFWGLGKNGLEDAWVVTRTYRTPNEIKGLYGKTIPGINYEDQGIPIYDYVDKDIHMIVAEDMVLIPAQKHGSPRTPVTIIPVGATPTISDPNGTHSEDVGESIYAADRGLYPHHNFMMSILLELMGRARTPGTKVYSADGNKTLEEDPYKNGTEIALRSGVEEVRPLEQIETTKDAVMFAGAISGEIQRGAVPHSVYGELQFQLSGFAINSLRQGVATIISPTVKAMRQAYIAVGNLLVDQYITGKFKPMELSGQDRNRDYFSEEITPELVKEAGGKLDVTILPELPQDEPAKMQMAQMARTPGPNGQPLMGDRDIRQDILEMQDPDAVQAVVNEQMMESATPMAQLMAWINTAIQMERDDLVQVYMSELEKLMRDMLVPPQTPNAPQGGGASPGGGGVPGIPADIMPSQAVGVPQAAATPQQGPNVPQGTPRPGRALPEEQQALS